MNLFNTITALKPNWLLVCFFIIAPDPIDCLSADPKEVEKKIKEIDKSEDLDEGGSKKIRKYRGSKWWELCGVQRMTRNQLCLFFGRKDHNYLTPALEDVACMKKREFYISILNEHRLLVAGQFEFCYIFSGCPKFRMPKISNVQISSINISIIMQVGFHSIFLSGIYLLKRLTRICRPSRPKNS